MRKGVMKIYAAERWLYLHHFHILPKVLKIFIRVVFGATIPYTCQIGGGGGNTLHTEVRVENYMNNL